MWDLRYSTDDYVFGTEPAMFLTTHAHLLPPGSNALVVADGEGRNSVYLAERGVEVTAMDVSAVGVEKARNLAAARGVTVDFHVADVLEWSWEPYAYDAVVAVFIQFLDPEQRAAVFDGLQQTLRPGGRLLLHGYRVEQLTYNTGGPPVASHLYDADLIRTAFAKMDIATLDTYDAEIREGSGHAGMSALLDLVATKR